MVYRGRLIFPFLAEICRLDTVSTAGVDPAGDEFDSGYDPIFDEPVLSTPTPAEGAPRGTDQTRYKDAILVPCQIETEQGSFEQLQAFASGNAPNFSIDVVLHFPWLERHDLVDENTGEALFRVGDRLVAFRNKRTEVLVWDLTRTPLFATEVQPRSFGLSGSGRPNLLLITFQDREKSSRTFSGV